MMKEEFEKIAGYEVSFEDYNNIIEPMYMATNLDKAEFVKIINKKAFALKPLKQLEKEMRSIAKQLEETCTVYTDTEKRETLEKLANEYTSRIGAAGNCTTWGTKWSCYYPTEITFYRSDYKTTKTIAF